MADARQPRGNLFQYTLKGVEELDHFPTDEAQERALNEIGHEVRVRDLSLGILILAAIVFITTACTRQLIHLLIPGMLGSADKDVSLILGVMAGIAVMRWLHRWGAARDLRRKLLDCGVPVCVPCAYLLQGLPSETVACPECGMPIPIEVRTLKRTCRRFKQPQEKLKATSKAAFNVGHMINIVDRPQRV